MAGSKINCYIDIASFYSYLAFVHLLNNKDTLRSHNVEVEFHPVLLGGINAATGNRPPWTLPAKAVYAPFDARRSAERMGLSEIVPPDDIMAWGRTVMPLRALLYIKSTYPQEVFETVTRYLFYAFFTPPNQNVSDPEVLKTLLAKTPRGFHGSGSVGSAGELLFKAEEVDRILQAANSKEFKDRLKNATDDAVEKGAFGAPWFCVRNASGKEEPFFGSDRFHFIWKFLDLPFQDVELLPPTAARAKI